MTNRNSHAPDALAQATAALRGDVGPQGPPPQLEASTVEALQTLSRAHAVRINERKKLMFRIARYGGVAASFAFVACLAGYLFLLDRTAALAFADVVENIRNAKNVSFITKMPTIVQGTKKGTLRQKFYFQGDVYRM